MNTYTQCPKCHVWADDLDGFGVLVHDECGFCSHPDVYGDECRACGRTVDMSCSTEGCKGTAKRWGRCRRCGAPPELRERALATYMTHGLTAAAEATGVSTSAVLRWRREAGVPHASRRGLPDEIGLTGREAAAASGASYRQVDNWQTTGFIQPTVQSTGSGRWRRYHPADVEQLRVAVQLLAAGMRLERLRGMDPDERARLLKVLAAEGFAP